MPRFTANEFITDTAEATNRSQDFLADNFEEATHQALYTARLKHGRARLGPSGRVIYTGFGTALVVIPERTCHGHPNGSHDPIPAPMPGRPPRRLPRGLHHRPCVAGPDGHQPPRRVAG